MITTDTGLIYLRYYQPGQPYVQNTPSGQEYVGVTRADICMIMVEARDVDNVLARRGGCCSKKKQLFHYANEADVRRWTNGGGR